MEKSDNVTVYQSLMGDNSGKQESKSIPSDELVPGDIIEIPDNGCDLYCDAVLISGSVIGKILTIIYAF